MSVPLDAQPAPAFDLSGTLQRLLANFAETAAIRDEQGGTPKAERDAIRASGLLQLSIPVAYGGLGADWRTTLDVVRQFATVDSSLAHVFGFHHLMLATVRLFSRQTQWQPWLEQTAANQWFWGNALNPLDNRTLSRRQGGWREFSGRKSFSSGSSDAEMLIVSALDESPSGKLLIAAIPSARSGISIQGDWNSIGQRQTDSGSVTFERVRIEENELLLDPGPLSTPFASLRPLIAQLIFANLFLGLAQGAFSEARQYTGKESRAWFLSSAQQANQDPYVLRTYGELQVQLESIRLLTEHANSLLDQAWRQAEGLSAATRGELAVAVSTAKVVAIRNGLDITNRIFEVMGARATHASLRLDRYWRNLRTQSLHDPIDYKLNELGNWGLNGQYPTPTFYS